MGWLKLCNRCRGPSVPRKAPSSPRWNAELDGIRREVCNVGSLGAAARWAAAEWIGAPLCHFAGPPRAGWRQRALHGSGSPPARHTRRRRASTGWVSPAVALARPRRAPTISRKADHHPAMWGPLLIGGTCDLFRRRRPGCSRAPGTRCGGSTSAEPDPILRKAPSHRDAHRLLSADNIHLSPASNGMAAARCAGEGAAGP